MLGTCPNCRAMVRTPAEFELQDLRGPGDAVGPVFRVYRDHCPRCSRPLVATLDLRDESGRPGEFPADWRPRLDWQVDRS